MSKLKYTIADLIAELSKFPQDMPVITNGYEGEYENISLPKVKKVKHSANQPYYTGQFIESGKTEDSFDAVVIEREVRELNS